MLSTLLTLMKLAREVHSEMNGGWPTANSQKRIKAFKASKELSPANKHMSELGSETFCFPVESSDETTALANILSAALLQTMRL